MADSSTQSGGEDSSPRQPPGVRECPPIVRFGLVPPTTPDERLLAKIMRDMCFVAGKLLHTAAKILNKSLQLSGVPIENFEEALRRTMQVIIGAKEEIVRLIYPKQEVQPDKPLLPSEQASPEIIHEAAKVVDSIIFRAKERIAELRGKENLAGKTIPRIVIESEIKIEASKIVEEIVNEAHRKIFQKIVQDFLDDLINEAETRVQSMKEDKEP